MTNRISEKDATISVISTGLESLHSDLFPSEEKGKCGIVRYCAEFPSIVNHSPKRSEREVAVAGGDAPSDSGSLNRIMNANVVIVGMVENALLCDQGRSYVVLPEVEFIPYTFPGQWLNERRTGSRVITERERQSDAA